MSMRKIYRELAKKHGVSVKEVREDMQEASASRARLSLPVLAVAKEFPESSRMLLQEGRKNNAKAVRPNKNVFFILIISLSIIYITCVMYKLSTKGLLSYMNYSILSHYLL